MFAAGLKGSIDDAIDKTITGELIVSNDDGFSDIPIATRRRGRGGRRGRGRLAPALHAGHRRGRPGKGFLTLIDPTTAAQVLSLDWDEGSDELLTGMGPTDAVIDKKWGEDNGIGVGDQFDAKTASGETLTFTVTGTFTDNTDFIGDYAASDVNAEAFGEARSTTNVFVGLEPGADAATVQRLDRRRCLVAVPDRQGGGPRGAQGLDLRAAQHRCSGSSTRCCCSR